MNFGYLLLPSLLAALLAYAVRPYRAWVGWTNAALSLVSLGAAGGFVAEAVNGQLPLTWGMALGPLHLPDFLRADSLSALLMVCVAGVAALALFFSPGLSSNRGYTPKQLRHYHLFTNLFIAAMLLAVSANNVGVMWIAIEATTIFSAMVIPLRLNKASVEASWKYILLGSVGISLAFAGTVLAYFDFVNVAGDVEQALNWPVLRTAAPLLQPEVMRLAFVFILIGYGTKAGLAPMHTWLPDAHSEAPAPLSALMSGVLLAVAMYAIARWKVVVDIAAGQSYSNHLLLTLGLLSVVIATFSVVHSRYYKRLLAYSSIEHTGLICIGLALGPLGVFAAMLHLINHTLVKSMLFVLSGRILHRYESTEIKQVTGLLKILPGTGVLFAVGMLALMGLPPFGLFVSEFALIRAGFVAGQTVWMVVVLILLAIAFVAFARHLNTMLYGPAPDNLSRQEADGWQLAPLAFSVAALVILGLTMPTPLYTLLNQIVEIIG